VAGAPLIEHTPIVWVVLCTAALVVGFAKTAIGGLGTVAVALFAAVMPARESTAALLLLLLVGDALAVTAYRGDCDWSLLRHLVPAVLPGLALGSLLLGIVDDEAARDTIAVVLLVLVLMQLLDRRRRPDDRLRAWSWRRTSAVGAAAGFATMVANAAGPVMTLYLVAQGVDKRRFLGTVAWFFMGVNLCKVPFAAALGLFDRDMAATTVLLAPLVLAGGLVGIAVARRLEQRSFDIAVLGASCVGALGLLIR
jgi:uncharacterized membrane protein YfcA